MRATGVYIYKFRKAFSKVADQEAIVAGVVSPPRFLIVTKKKPPLESNNVEGGLFPSGSQSCGTLAMQLSYEGSDSP